MRSLLITLVAPQALEGALLEALLELPFTEAFSSSPGRGHGLLAGRMSVGEQVAGWRREVRIEVLIAEDDREAMLAALRRRFATQAVRYWVVAAVEEGSLGDDTPLSWSAQ